MGFKRAASQFTMVLIMLAAAVSALAWSPDKVIYANADPNKYYVECDVTNQVTTVYEKSETGKFDKIARQMICTTGAKATPTPEGMFRFNDRRRRFGYFSKYTVYAQYWVHVSGGIYFHSILYTKQKEGTFTRSSYNDLGSQASHGCIRMLPEDVRWIYYNVPAGSLGAIVANEKNDKLRASLMPTIGPRQYVAEPDKYEIADRSQPRAVLTADAAFKMDNGTVKTLGKGSVVYVLSSGKQACRVQADKLDGLVATKALEFIPNGYEDVERVYRASERANVYAAADAKSEVIDVVQADEQLDVEETVNSYCKVNVNGQTGYVLKNKVAVFRQTPAVKTIWKARATETDIQDETDAELHDEIDKKAAEAVTEDEPQLESDAGVEDETDEVEAGNNAAAKKTAPEAVKSVLETINSAKIKY